MSELIIPDGIEPVVGWKSWRLLGPTPGGRVLSTLPRLLSPMGSEEWHPGEPLVARCLSTNVTPRWITVPVSDPRPCLRLAPVNRPAMFPAADSWSVYLPKPQKIPQKGWEWRLLDDPHHPPPNKKCRCGIYIASEIREAHRYYDDMVFGTVKGWGKTIVGTHGWRVEYAYPERLWVHPRYGEEMAQALSEHYGVPVEIDRMVNERHVAMLGDLLTPPPRKWWTLTAALVNGGFSIVNVALYTVGAGWVSLLAASANVGIAAFLGYRWRRGL